MNDFLSYAYSKSINENHANNKRARTVNEELVLSSLKMAYSEARKYYESSTKELSIEDVTQAAMEGLCVAAEKYDDLNVKFSSYAWFWVKKYVLDAINITGRQLSVSTVDGYNRVTDGIKFISKDETVKASSAKSQEDITLEETLFPIIEDNFIEKIDIKINVLNARNTIKKLLEPLTKNEKRICCSYFGLAPFDSVSTVQQVATQFKFTKPEVEAILEESINKMREYASTEKIDLNKLMSDVQSIKIANMDIEKAPDYIENKFFKHTVIDETLQAIQDNSGLSYNNMQMAINFDIDGLYNFIAVRKIAGYTVYKRHTIVKRYSNYTVTMDSYYSVYDADGNMVYPEEFIKKEKSVSIREFSKYCKENRITQMMSPLHPL